jgi:hypothetical protein
MSIKLRNVRTAMLTLRRSQGPYTPAEGLRAELQVRRIVLSLQCFVLFFFFFF